MKTQSAKCKCSEVLLFGGLIRHTAKQKPEMRNPNEVDPTRRNSEFRVRRFDEEYKAKNPKREMRFESHSKFGVQRYDEEHK